MNRHRVTLLTKLALLLLVFLTACQKDKPAEKAVSAKDLTVIFATTTGLMADGYNELILQGVMESLSAYPGITLHLSKPDSLAEARVLFDQWKAASGADKALILCGPEFEPLVEDVDLPEGRILLLDSDKTYGKGVSTALLKRYGGAYLAGAMMKDVNMLVIKGLDGDRIIDTITDGLADGYQENGGELTITYVLSDGYEGMNMADDLFRIIYTQDDFKRLDHQMDIIVPVCGASALGAFSISQSYQYASAGVGADCALYSDFLPFSLILDAGAVAKEYILQWVRDAPWPAYADFGLSTGHVSIRYNERFDPSSSLFFVDWPISLGEWRSLEVQYKEIALEKEASHAY